MSNVGASCSNTSRSKSTGTIEGDPDSTAVYPPSNHYFLTPDGTPVAWPTYDELVEEAKKRAKAKKRAEANRGKAQPAEECLSQTEEEETGKAADTEEESDEAEEESDEAEEESDDAEEESDDAEEESDEAEEESDAAESVLRSESKQRRDSFDDRAKARGRLPEDGSKLDKKHKLLLQMATDIIKTGRFQSNACINCEKTKKECFVPISDLQDDGGLPKCAFSVWLETPCSVGLFRALEPIVS
jgi:hypothetical protein